ncbi:MAG TPA: glycosyltransferase, partial [Candidatus Tectomicrobia bacterium]|nr:glycosyltransferase [Candidatus Tectomicrobia bacterium]
MSAEAGPAPGPDAGAAPARAGEAAGPVSVILVVHDRLELTRGCVESLAGSTVPFELCVIDNGSRDGTDAWLRTLAWPGGLRHARNAENVGLIRALNQGAALARGTWLCFLHNDTLARDAGWLARLRDAVGDGRDVGLAGLYGARRVRRDGRYAGRTIVSTLEGDRPPAAPVVEVAAVDGVCLFLRRDLLEAVGGFDEGYGFFHGYDRDLSFAVRARGRRCVIVRAPFVHLGGGTRTQPGAPRAAAADLAERRAAL